MAYKKIDYDLDIKLTPASASGPDTLFGSGSRGSCGSKACNTAYCDTVANTGGCGTSNCTCRNPVDIKRR